MENLNIDNEVWKSIPNFPELEVSNFGRVRTKPKLRYTQQCNSGYLRFTGVNDHGQHKTVTIHRAVMMAFYPIGNHKAGNRSNNNLDNLEWVTPKENIAHATARGSFDRKNQLSRQRMLNDVANGVHMVPKINEDIAREMAILSDSGLSHAAIGRKYEVSAKAVCRAIDRHRKFSS